MKEIIRTLGYYLYAMVPKFNHAVVWGWPLGEDSSRALIDNLQNTKIRRVILLVPDVLAAVSAFAECGHKTILIKKTGLAAWCWFLTARYVFFTHRCFMRKFPPSVVSVNIWHGMPLKKIGWMLDGGEGISSRYVLATSAFWAPLMAQAMRPWGTILITGLPRNDRLFSNRESVRHKLGLSCRTDIHKIIAWLPTYRKSVRGEIRIDGQESGCIFGIDDVTPKDLNAFCQAHNMLIWVKPHPMSAFECPIALSHLIVMDDDGLRHKGLSLYELLGASDALISDISSVVIDYLLLDRPIIHCFPDLEAYRYSRGFTLEPIEDYFMGPIVTNVVELNKALSDSLHGADPDGKRRRDFRDLFHKHQGGEATKRLLDMVGLPMIHNKKGGNLVLVGADH